MVERILYEVTTGIEEYGAAAKASNQAVASTNTNLLPFVRSSLLKHIIRSMHRMMQSSGTAEGLRTLIDSSLVKSVKLIMQNKVLFGPAIYSIAINIMAMFVHNEPTSLAILQEAHVPDVFYDAIESGIEPAIEVITSVPNAIGALCLNQAGQNQFNEHKSVMPTFFSIFTSEPHIKVLLEKDNANAIGGAVDELVRHHPTLKDVVFESIVGTLQKIEDLGNAFQVPKDQESLYRLIATTSSAPAREPPAATPAWLSVGQESAVASGVATPAAPEIDEQEAAKVERGDNAIASHIDIVCRFLDGMFQHVPHCHEFVSNTNGLDRLARLYALPCLPLGYGASVAADSMVQLLRSMTEVSATQTLASLTKHVRESLDETKAYWEQSSDQSRLAHFILLAERQASTMQTILLVAFFRVDGQERVIELLNNCLNAADRIFDIPEPDQTSDDKNELVYVLGCTKVALGLLQSVVSSNLLFASPQTTQLATSDKPPTDEDYFEPHQFLVKCRAVFMPLATRLWNSPWLMKAPSDLIRGVVNTVLEIMRGEREEVATDTTAPSFGEYLRNRTLMQPPVPRTVPVDENRLQVLMDMGFSREAASRALAIGNNNTARATEYLLAHASSPEGEGSSSEPVPVPVPAEGSSSMQTDDATPAAPAETTDQNAPESSTDKGKGKAQDPEVVVRDWAKELEDARQALRPDIGPRLLALADKDPQLVFDLKSAFVGPANSFQASCLDALFSNLQSLAPNDSSFGIRCRLLAIVFNDTNASDYLPSSESVRGLLDYLLKIPAKSLDTHVEWLAPYLLAIEALIAIADEILPVTLPKDEEPIPTKKMSTPVREGTKSKSTILSFLLSDLLSYGKIYGQVTEKAKRRATISKCAMDVVISLCSSPSTAQQTPTDLKDLPSDIVNIRKTVLDVLAKSIKDTSSITPIDARYGRLIVHAELCSRLLNPQPTISSKPAQDDVTIHLAKIMLEKNFVGILTTVVGELDLNYPNVKSLVSAVLRPLEYLSKVAIKMGRSDKSKTSLAVDEESESSSSMSVDDEEEESEVEAANDLYRNSALGMFSGVCCTGPTGDG
ncbi:hypothetical protein FRC08_008650 [Ceratobasidium sp. 394]|nr:hypothetical protein FRC08_008650 [Ceratobasidium sp. 394]